MQEATMKSTLVSVLLPTYNAEAFLGESVVSILNQSFRDFELLIINDSSSDRTTEIISSFRDPRIVAIHNPTNQRLSKCLNSAIESSKGKYLARMDADDRAHPDRLKLQVEFMESNPGVDILGTGFCAISGRHRTPIINPLKDDEIKAAMIFDTAFGHPTVMFRKDALVRSGLRYNPDFDFAEDYELWTRCAGCMVFANLARPLMDYRVHPGQISLARKKKQEQLAAVIRESYIRSLGVKPTREQIDLIHRIATGNVFDIPSLAKQLEETCKIFEGNPNLSIEAVRREFTRRLSLIFMEGLAGKEWRSLRNAGWIETRSLRLKERLKAFLRYGFFS
jgi:glycosyltransferase involved in cell wall biosynthesis